jgi:hypothetical protein
MAPAAPSDGRRPAPAHWLTRFAFLRMLGLVYTVAFASVVLQGEALFGSRGLLPVADHLAQLARDHARPLEAFLDTPTLFWLGASDAWLRACAWLGLAGSLALLLGLANAPLLALLWLLYGSFVHVGQIFTGYGWDILLLETGFLAIFLAPAWRLGPFPRASPPSRVVIVLLRWLTLRLMLGAGLIKLRVDPCWLDLSCMVFHYETQPNPNPLSWYFHHLPVWFHQLEVLGNHAVELVAPLFVFGPRPLRRAAGLSIITFQVLLILSGNLSFLNWLTIAIAIACLDDGVLRKLLPERWLARLDTSVAGAREGRASRVVGFSLAAVVAVLSVNPVQNLFSPHQRMNAGFDPFFLVNTYGAFGRITRERFEIVLEGTADDPSDPGARWVAYEFRCKPGAPARRPCWISPYHLRLDWQMWFLAMPRSGPERWFLRLVSRLLAADAAARRLLAPGPFETEPPRAIRAQYYAYRFTRPGESGWWERRLVRPYLPPLERDDPRLVEALRRSGWR